MTDLTVDQSDSLWEETVLVSVFWQQWRLIYDPYCVLLVRGMTSFSFSSLVVFLQQFSHWKQFVVLNSRSHLDADGVGWGCLSPYQACSLVIYSVMVKGSGLRVRKMTSCQTFNTTSLPWQREHTDMNRFYMIVKGKWRETFAAKVSPSTGVQTITATRHTHNTYS